MSSKASRLNGKDLQLFLATKDDEDNVVYKPLALAKTFALNLSSNEMDSSSKDDGIWSSVDVASLSWEITTQQIISADADRTIDLCIADLYDLYVQHQPITIVTGKPTNANTDSELPSTGWTAPTSGSLCFKGEAVITSINISADQGSAATGDITLSGCGELKRLATAEE